MTDPYTIEPIETVYKSISFKSRLEAQTALFFDLINLNWFYEYKKFDFGYIQSIGQHIVYTPDFYLPELRRWIETKGPEPYELAVVKCALLAKRTKELVQMWSGSFGRQTIYSYRYTKDNKLKCWKADYLDRDFVEKSAIGGISFDRLLYQVTRYKF